MGRYDKIRYGNGSAWVQPSEIKYGNGSAGVSYGANDSSNTNTINYGNGSSGKRATLNKGSTVNSTLNYKELRGPINGAGLSASKSYLSNGYAYNSGNSWRFYRGYRGYTWVTASSTSNCRIGGVFTASDYEADSSACYDDMLLYTNGYLQLRSKYNSGTTYRQYAYQTMSRGAWHYVNFNSLYLYNGNTSYDGRSLLQIDGGSTYGMRTANGGSTASSAVALYCTGTNYPRFGGTSTGYKGSISLYGVCYTTKYTATINIDNYAVGASINGASSVTTGNCAYKVSGNYTNTTVTTGT